MKTTVVYGCLFAILLRKTFVSGQAPPNSQVGLALAGGGSRAFSACTGILRGFQQKRIEDGKELRPAMESVKYNSGISGGSLPAMLYTFAQVPTDQLLETGRLTDPAKITPELLSTLPKTSIGYSITTNPLATPKLSRFFFILTRVYKFHSYWTGIVYRNYFKPYHIPRNKYFASSEKEVDEIVKNNPKLQKEDFLLPRHDVKTMPMLLYTMRGARADLGIFMKKTRRITEDAWNNYKMDESLNYFTRNYPQARPSMTKQILKYRAVHDGNLPVPYTATPSAVSTKFHGEMLMRKTNVTFPVEDTKPFEWGTRTRFAAETASSMSTNFLGLSYRLGLLLQNVRKVTVDGYTSTMGFADGGLSDLCGILPLMQHDINKIVCTFNFNQNPPYSDFSTTYADIFKAAPSTSRDDDNFDADFRTWLTLIDPRILCYFGFFGGERIDSVVLNHVFDDPNLDRLKELMVKYNSLFKAGEPLIATLHDLQVIDNPFWGLKAGGKVDLTFIYMNMPKKFSEQVPVECAPPPEGKKKIDEYGRFNNEIMRAVPELPWNPPVEGLQYTKEQVNMISYLGSWMVNHAWNGLQGHDGTMKFEGFQEVFESGTQDQAGSVEGETKTEYVSAEINES